MVSTWSWLRRSTRVFRDQEDIAALFKRLGFIGVRLITVAQACIGELHIGLEGLTNALYLKDLADKTRRGLVGRIRKGRSAGGLCYGYDVVASEERGGRTINETWCSCCPAHFWGLCRRPLAKGDRAAAERPGHHWASRRALA